MPITEWFHYLLNQSGLSSLYYDLMPPRRILRAGRDKGTVHHPMVHRQVWVSTTCDMRHATHIARGGIRQTKRNVLIRPLGEFCQGVLDFAIDLNISRSYVQVGVSKPDESVNGGIAIQYTSRVLVDTLSRVLALSVFGVDTGSPWFGRAKSRKYHQSELALA